MNGLSLLLWAANEAIAKPVVVQTNQELTTVLMSDKLLGPFLLLNAIQLIIFLIKTIWSSEKKRQDQILDRLERLEKNMPTKETIEIMIYKELRQREKDL